MQAGTNQFQNFAALMQNFSHAVEATDTAINSAGSAARENERFMESLAARSKDFGPAKHICWEPLRANNTKA